MSLRLSAIELEDLGSVGSAQLQHKATEFAALIEREFIDADGFVVVRDAQGQPEDYGDTALWTSLYAASLAWQVRVTESQAIRDRLHRTLWALHRLHAESGSSGRLVRHPNPQIRNRFPAPHKDTYAGFYFAVGQSLGEVRDKALQKALRNDIDELTTAFLDNGFRWTSESGPAVNFTPHLTSDHWAEVLADFSRKPDKPKRVANLLRSLRWYFALQQLRWPEELLATERLLRRGNLDSQSPPWDRVVRGLWQALVQAQIGVRRSSQVPRAYGLQQSPYQKLDRWTQYVLAHLPPQGPQHATEARVLPSQSLHALQVLKVAAIVLPEKPQYGRAYRTNLRENAAFLTTLEDWDSMDEALMHAALGETRAHTRRPSGLHLAPLALMLLTQKEQDPEIKRIYQSLLDRQARIHAQDLNAMTAVLQSGLGLTNAHQGLALWCLSRYPADRRGFGEQWWKRHRRSAAEHYGGIIDGKSREARPPDERPRDAFLWQRNPRSLRGDRQDWRYPPLDYLVAYWMARFLLKVPANER